MAKQNKYNKITILLFSSFVLFFILLGISPVHRDVWIAEMIPVVIIFLSIVVIYFKYHQFSLFAIIMMVFWLVLHTIGGHWTFANVPFSFISDIFSFERNHFDRIAHFSVGFYAFAIVEFLLEKKLCNKIIAYLFALFAIMSVAGGYEVIEWWYAVIEGGEAGVEFLGSQGDIWDAQKDILADTLGAILALGLFKFFKEGENDEYIAKN
jgi:putative membrane protein